jgi:DNA-binding NarL/FixJ family response regulator
VNETEKRVVELIGEGYTRWKIAEELGLGESTIRRIVRRLCEHYDCTQRDLPKVVGKENRNGRPLS